MKSPDSAISAAANTSDSWKAWLPVISLAFAAFVFNTTEFVPIGLLPDIAKSFSMEVAHTGLLITGYAWIVALMSLPLTILSASFERRKLLATLFVIFIGSHILAGFAQSFTVLMLARMGIACAHAVFWSITIPLAARLAPNGKTSKALAFMITGSSLATVLGVPIGTIIGQQTGWRITFLCIAVVALLVMLVLMVILPRLPSINAGSFKSLPLLLKRKALVNVYLLTVIIVSGYFTAYTYITPFMTQVGGFSETFIVYLLLFIGGAGIIGSYVFTRFSERRAIATFMVPLGVLLLCLLMLNVASFSVYSTIILCIIWGVAFTMIMLALQTKVLSLASDASDVAMSMYSGIFNVGIGAGALTGSIVLSQLDTAYVGFAGALYVAAAFALSYFVSMRYWGKQTTNTSTLSKC